MSRVRHVLDIQEKQRSISVLWWINGSAADFWQKRELTVSERTERLIGGVSFKGSTLLARHSSQFSQAANACLPEGPAFPFLIAIAVWWPFVTGPLRKRAMNPM